MSLAICTACSGRIPAGDRIDLGFERQLLGSDLVAHRGDRVVLRPDEDDALVFDAAREVLVFGQETVARVHGLRPCGLAGSDDLVGHQVALAAGRRTDEHRFVGQFDMARIAVGFGVHGHGGDAHLLGGLDDAAGDLAPIGNQDLLEHMCLKAECCRACATGCRASCP
jgi:hypothetical protein